jgi:hypothetical protein
MSRVHVQGWRQRRFLPLLVSLAVLMPLYPVMLELGHQRLYRLVFQLVLVAGVYSVSGNRRALGAALLLGIPAFGSQVLLYAVPERAMFVLATVLTTGFMVFVTVRILLAVLRKGRVTGDRIAGAISVYLLIGVVWALLYGLVAIFDPGAFRTPEGLGSVERGVDGEYAFLYFSFVTLTTLGYGEISASAPFSQMLAWTEAVVGQLYLAILIARLVGLHIAESGRDHGADSEGAVGVGVSPGSAELGGDRHTTGEAR